MKHFLSILFGRPTGFGTAGISRQRVCGAVTIVGTGLTAAQWGVETDETGVNVESYEVRYFREVNEKLANISGQTRGRALADAFSRDITINGEVIGSTGLMAFTAATVSAGASIANDDNDFGASAGNIIFDEGTVTQNRSGWRSVSLKLSSDPLCV